MLLIDKCETVPGMTSKRGLWCTFRQRVDVTPCDHFPETRELARHVIPGCTMGSVSPAGAMEGFARTGYFDVVSGSHHEHP